MRRKVTRKLPLLAEQVVALGTPSWQAYLATNSSRCGACSQKQAPGGDS